MIIFMVVTVGYGWSTTRCTGYTAAPPCAIGLYTFYLGATAARTNGQLGCNAILVALNVGQWNHSGTALKL